MSLHQTPQGSFLSANYNPYSLPADGITNRIHTEWWVIGQENFGRADVCKLVRLISEYHCRFADKAEMSTYAARRQYIKEMGTLFINLVAVGALSENEKDCDEMALLLNVSEAYELARPSTTPH